MAAWLAGHQHWKFSDCNWKFVYFSHNVESLTSLGQLQLSEILAHQKQSGIFPLLHTNIEMLTSTAAAESLRSSPPQLISPALHNLVGLFFSFFFNLFSDVYLCIPANMYCILYLYVAWVKTQRLTSCLSFYGSGHLPFCVLQSWASLSCSQSAGRNVCSGLDLGSADSLFVCLHFVFTSFSQLATIFSSLLWLWRCLQDHTM